MIKNQYGRFLQEYELYPLLGIGRGGHLPPEGFDPVEIQGTLFRCDPAKAPRYNDRGRRVKVSKHRVHYLCKDCMRWIPFGRAGQHRKGAEHQGKHTLRIIGMTGKVGEVS